MYVYLIVQKNRNTGKIINLSEFVYLDFERAFSIIKELIIDQVLEFQALKRCDQLFFSHAICVYEIKKCFILKH